MTTHAFSLPGTDEYPVRIRLTPALAERHRLSVALRIILAIPHLVLVGGPLGVVLVFERSAPPAIHDGWGAGGGVLGAVAFVVAVIAWFAILISGRYPDGLRELATYYLRWRVRVMAYVALLEDDYPPFGEGPYPVSLDLPIAPEPRDRWSVALRPLLVIPQLVALWVIGIGWCLATIAAWFAILFTGTHPRSLYAFGVGALRWTARVEAYLLLLRDEYPPFSLS